MRYLSLLFIPLILSCTRQPNTGKGNDINYVCPTVEDSTRLKAVTDKVTPDKIVVFAKTLLGTKYSFGCSAPSTGFDCSGFVTYVFNHFNITVPRSSVDFTNEGTTIALADAQTGDLILFTGTNSKVRTVGHIGLIVTNHTTGISFIHSSSGKENAVVITPLNDYYMDRFVKVIRIYK